MAIEEASSVDMNMEIKQDLWNSMARPVAEAKSSRTRLRQVIARRVALIRVRVSSAY